MPRPTLTAAQKDQLRKELVAQADSTHTQYPQYRNHWDTWVLGYIRRGTRTKFGQAFVRGDIVLVKPGPPKPGEGLAPGPFRVAYSFRNQIDTSIEASSVELL